MAKQINDRLRNVLVCLGIAFLFLVLSYGFVPQVLGGKIVNQSDISGWKGMTHEISQHNEAHPDDPTYWTNSMFGGMPSTAMYDKFEGDLTNPLYKFLLLGKRPATYIFITLLGAFLLMLSMGVDKLLAVGGAIAVAFCSYNFQIIQVGHNTKMQAIAFFPWVLAGLIFTYRSAMDLKDEGKSLWRSVWFRRTVLGSVLFALALSFQIKANHPQITWYLAVCVFLYAITEFVSMLMDRTLLRTRAVRFFTASALLLVVGTVGIATNANKLIPTWEYSKHTMRGGSELSKDASGSDREKSKGLELDYATAWSYGINEMPNLLVANFNGGVSAGRLSEDSETARVLKEYGYRGKALKDMLSALPLYWGPQPFTAGPMYLGAIPIFLFVLGLLLFRGREKWWLLAATVFAVLLAWGSHAMWFTRLAFDILPMYNKFRTVSMALTVLQVSVPLLGFVVLDRICRGKYRTREILKCGGISYLLTAGFCLLCVLVPGLAGSFSSPSDASILPEPLIDPIMADRRALLRSDALRSFLFISAFAAIAAAALLTGKEKAREGRVKMLGLACCLLVLLDLGVIGKRYLNGEHFVTPKDFSSQFDKRPVDEFILDDTELDYRVLDMSVNTFNDSHPSYWHKCIGGYSPAKMQRYQDLIERYISREMSSIDKVARNVQTISGVAENFPETPVLNMLNTKYVILQDDLMPVENPYRMGNCWFVDSVATAGSADEEIALLGSVDLSATAIVRESPDFIPSPAPEGPDTDDIRLVSYAPNELRYAYSTRRERLAVFSEIYYPGWVSPQVELFRADWVLRAAVIPAGEGEIVMRFEPRSYRTGAAVSTAASSLLLALLALSLALQIASSCRRNNPDNIQKVTK